MTDLQLFQMPGEDKPLRVILIDGEPWLVAADIAFLLGYRDASHAVRLLKSGEKRPHLVGTPSGGQQEFIVISEAGFYRLVMRSNRPEADAFQTWVTSEVLPSIRKTGGYGQRSMTRRELAQMVIDQEDRLAELTPKAEAFETYMDASGSESLATVAKMLGTGQNRLFSFLRAKGVLISTAGARFNTPKQTYVERGWFDVVAGTRWSESQQEDVATYTTRVLPKGVEGIRKLLAAR